MSGAIGDKPGYIVMVLTDGEWMPTTYEFDEGFYRDIVDGVADADGYRAQHPGGVFGLAKVEIVMISRPAPPEHITALEEP